MVIPSLELSGAPAGVRIRAGNQDDVLALVPLIEALTEVVKDLNTWAVIDGLIGSEWRPARGSADLGCMVAEDQRTGALVGLASHHVMPVLGQSASVFVSGIYVVPSYRRSHIGYQIMSAIAREAYARECESMMWRITPGDRAAERFSLNLGAESRAGGLEFRLPRRAIRWLALVEAENDAASEAHPHGDV